MKPTGIEPVPSGLESDVLPLYDGSDPIIRWLRPHYVICTHILGFADRCSTLKLNGDPEYWIRTSAKRFTATRSTIKLTQVMLINQLILSRMSISSTIIG